MANYAKVSSKGQITLPASIRKHLNVEPGMALEIVREGEGIYITTVKGDISSLKGSVQAEGVQDFTKIRKQVMEELASDKTKAD